MKSADEHFRDWEAHVFGFGYGSGEEHVIPALKQFLELCDGGPNGESYDFRTLEAGLSPTVTWLMINTLAHAGIIEYGSSPRFAWLSQNGVALKTFVASKTIDQLVGIVTQSDEDYIPCYPECCNCEPQHCQTGNPFWAK